MTDATLLLTTIKDKLAILKNDVRIRLDAVKQEHFPDNIQPPYLVSAIVEDDSLGQYIQKLQDALTTLSYLSQSIESGVF